MLCYWNALAVLWPTVIHWWCPAPRDPPLGPCGHMDGATLPSGHVVAKRIATDPTQSPNILAARGERYGFVCDGRGGS